ncbi:MAG TPA: RHS repeat-associated core domain-containing protein [Vicinamibacterales bacterium]|jgi:RHS repeat-associated protein|nr:RHS repeat-associated core domain-containing protein [Vicinamibacterales bacterium]
MPDETTLATTPASTAPGYSGTSTYFAPGDSETELQRKAGLLVEEAANRVLQEAQAQRVEYADPLSLAQAIAARITLNPVGPTTPQLMDRVRAAVRTALNAQQDDLFLKAVELGTAHAIVVTDGDSSVQRRSSSADPVILFNGQFTYAATDVRILGAGIDFVFVRTYKNQAAYLGPLGYRWDHSYNLWLRVSPDGRTINCATGALREDRYVRHDTLDYWVPPDGEDGVFTPAGSSFVWRSPEGRRHFYEPDPSRPGLLHRITRIEDRFGNYLAFAYVDGQLRRIEINHPRRFVELTYDDAGRLTGLADHTARAWRYRYDGNDDLIAVTTPPTARYPHGLTTCYEYSSAISSPALQHNLLRIIDPAGQVHLENEYGTDAMLVSFNRVIRQRQGGGETRFEYADVIQTFAVDYADHERPTHETVVVERNGHGRRHVFNRAGNLLLREESVLLDGQPATLRWHSRYNRDGNLVATLTPEGTLSQYLYGRDLFMRRHAEVDEAALTSAAAMTPDTRQSFGRVLAFVRRRNAFRLIDLNLIRGVWGDMFPDIFAGNRHADENGELVADDTIVKFEYERAFGQVRSVSDPRFTNSADPAALVEHTRHTATLTRYHYGGPASDPTRFVVSIVRPSPTFPDGTQGPAIVETFTRPDTTPAYDSRGRVLRHVNAVGAVVEYTYVLENPNEPRSGHLRQMTVDPGDLAITTEYEVDELGRVIVTRLPRSAGLSDGRFVTRTTYNELDQVVETVTSPPFLFSTRRFYDRNGMLEREERQATDDSGAPVQGGVEVRTFTYDAELNLTGESVGGADSAAQLVTRYCLGSSGERLATILPAGNRVWHRYDERLLQVELTMGACSPDAATWRSAYDADGRPRRQIDARGNVTSLQYDPLGRVIVEEDPLGHVTVSSYDKADKVTCVRHFERREDGFYLLTWTQMQYDELSRPIRTSASLFENPLGPVQHAQLDSAFLDSSTVGRSLATLTFYDAAGRIERVLDPLQREIRYEYDAAGRLSRYVDPMGNETRKRYDSQGNAVRSDRVEMLRDPQSGTITGQRVFATSSAYDELDRLTTTTSSLGNVIQYAYDSRGKLTARTDPLGNRTRFSYDIFGRRTTIEQDLTATGLGSGLVQQMAVTRFQYDDNGDNTAVIDALGRRTEQQYDTLGRRRLIVYPDGSRMRFEYNPDGHLRATIDGNGTRKRYSVDAMGRITRVEVDVPTASADVEIRGETFQAFTYDGAGRCLHAENDFAACDYVYNSMGWALEEVTTPRNPAVTPTPLSLRREFDDVGALVGLTYPEGRRIGLERNELGRLEAVRNLAQGTSYPGVTSGANSFEIATISYTGTQQSRYAFGNGASTSYAYDGDGRVIEIEHRGPAAVLLTTQYAYDAAAQMRVRHDIAPGRDVTEVFRYDSMYRLRNETVESRPAFSAAAFAPPSSMPPEPIPNNQQQIDAVIGPLSLPASATTRDYDLAGNWLRAANSGGDMNFVVNQLDQYSTVDSGAFHYDRNGNLRNDGTRRYTYDAANRLVRVDEVSNGQTVAAYFHDAHGRRNLEIEGGTTTRLLWDGNSVIGEYQNGQLFASYVFDDGIDRPLHLAVGSSEAWYHQDILGSVRLLTTPSGGSAAAYRYSAFGALEESAGAIFNPIRYTGHRFSTVLSMYDYRARQYHPLLGRFLQRDPAGMADGTNLYVYAGNNPLVFGDPLGTARARAEALNSHPMNPDEYVLTDPFDPLGLAAKGIIVSEHTRSVRKNQATIGVKETEIDPPYERNWLLHGPEWFNRAVQNAAEGGRSAKAAARFESLNEHQTKIKRILEVGHGCAACHITTRVWNTLGPQAINPENGLPYDWAINMNGYNGWVDISSRSRFFVESMTAIATTKMQVDAAFAAQWAPATTPRIGPRYHSFDEAFGQGGHVLEVVVRKKNGREIARWWEASEGGGLGRAGHTEQKALSRIKLGPDIEIEMRGWHNPCPYSGGCMNTMRYVAEEYGTDIMYRTPRGNYFFSEGVE